MATLSERMIYYRAKNRMTQKELAEKCDCTEQTICGIEKGRVSPSKITEAKINIVIGGDEVAENFNLAD